MQERGKLNVTLNRYNTPDSQESYSQSQPSNQNEFLNPPAPDPPSQSVGLQTVNRAPPPKNPTNSQQNQHPLQSALPNPNKNQLAPIRPQKAYAVPQQVLDLRSNEQQNSKAKVKPNEPKVDQPEEELIASSKNKSALTSIVKTKDIPGDQGGEARKMEQINKNRQKLSSSIDDLKGNYALLERQQKQANLYRRRNQNAYGTIFSPEKEKEVQLFLQKKQKEKKIRHKILENINLKEEHKKNLQERQIQQLREREKKRRLKQLKKYSKFEDKHDEWKQQFEEKQKYAQEIVKKYQSKVGYHIRALKYDEERSKKQQEEEAKTLRERKELFKPLDQSQLIEHQRWHADKVDQLNYERLQAREEELQRIAEENSKMNDLWHGNSHTIVEQELQQRRKKKREPKEKARRIKQYKQYVKRQFLPKTYQHRSLDPPPNSTRVSNSHRQVRRYRYYKGMAIGQVKQELPLPKTDRQARRIGDDYLEYVRALPKKIEDPQETLYELDPEDIEILQKKFNGIGRVKRSIHPIYDNGIKKKTAIEVTKNVRRDELQMIVMQLQASDNRLRNKQVLLNHNEYGSVSNVQGQQKAINQGFVENIERKLALLAQL